MSWDHGLEETQARPDYDVYVERSQWDLRFFGSTGGRC
jgi:hypothetical protein